MSRTAMEDQQSEPAIPEDAPRTEPNGPVSPPPRVGRPTRIKRGGRRIRGAAACGWLGDAHRSVLAFLTGGRAASAAITNCNDPDHLRYSHRRAPSNR